MSVPTLAPPWYVHPAEAPGHWAWLAEQHAEVSFAVVNVHNGPGPEDDAYYPAALAALGNLRLLGYVPVDYGRRDVAEVARDIEAWRRLYGVGGILLDEIPSSAASLGRCAEYAAAARSAGVTLLAGNPGVFPSPGHLELFDTTCVFEGTAGEYAGYEHPTWAARLPAERFWHLVHSCPAQELEEIRRAAGRHGAGHVFATDRRMPNPWLGLPTGLPADVPAEHVGNLALSPSQG